MATGRLDYLAALLREARRLYPVASWNRLNHAVTFDPADDSLILLLCVGDALYRHKINSADLSDDPTESAARLVEQAKKHRVDCDPAHYW